MVRASRTARVKRRFPRADRGAPMKGYVLSTEVIQKFQAIGADVEIRNERFERVFDPASGEHRFGSRFSRTAQTPVRVDVRTVGNRERFEIAIDARGANLNVVDYDRHRQLLLLTAREKGAAKADKFLCGFDERHWFSAAVPNKGVCSIDSALEALMPPAVRTELDRQGVTGRERFRRKTPAFLRQGEWFFTPTNRSFKGKRPLQSERLPAGCGEQAARARVRPAPRRRTGGHLSVAEPDAFGGGPPGVDSQGAACASLGLAGAVPRSGTLRPWTGLAPGSRDAASGLLASRAHERGASRSVAGQPRFH